MRGAPMKTLAEMAKRTRSSGMFCIPVKSDTIGT